MCTNCGTVNDYLTANEFVDFYENMYRIRKKSIYHRKYHIEDVRNASCQKHGIEISYANRHRIYFQTDIYQVSPQVDNSRKRMVSIKFILRQLFRALEIEYKFILLSKSKKTLKYCNQWWG